MAEDDYGKVCLANRNHSSLQAGYMITPRHTQAPSTSLARATSSLQCPFSLYHWLKDGKAESDRKERGLQSSTSLTKEKLN